MFATKTPEQLHEILLEFGIDAAIVAGGAVRDHLLGAKETKDIDIFSPEINIPPGWKCLGKHEPDGDWFEDEEYRNLNEEFAFDLYNFERNGEPIQVIVPAKYTDPVGFVYDAFDLSSSRCYLGIDGKIDDTPSFRHGLREKTITSFVNTERTKERAKRVLEKFPEHFNKIVGGGPIQF
jgi:hypothetical protein